MRKNILHKIRNRIYSICVFPILVMLMSTHCEGWKDLYLINCSYDNAIITTSLSGIEKGMVGFYKSGPYETEPLDTIPLNKRMDYYQWLFITKSFKELGDSLLIILEPEEGMRIIHQEWLFAPTKFRVRDLDVYNLKIITNSDTFIVRNRKEILKLRFSRKCKDGIHFKTIKYGRHGTPIMREKNWVWRGR